MRSTLTNTPIALQCAYKGIWEDNTKQVHDLLAWDVEIDALLMNRGFEEILKTATAYNGGTTPAWHDAVICFTAFELGIDPIGMPEWWLEIL